MGELKRMISLTAAILLRTDQASGLNQKPFKATATRALEADQSLCNLLESIKCTYERNTERKGYGRGGEEKDYSIGM